MDKQPIPITAVHVRNVGDHLICELEINGQWIEILNAYAGPMAFSVGQIIEWRGIQSAIDKHIGRD